MQDINDFEGCLLVCFKCNSHLPVCPAVTRWRRPNNQLFPTGFSHLTCKDNSALLSQPTAFEANLLGSARLLLPTWRVYCRFIMRSFLRTNRSRTLSSLLRRRVALTSNGWLASVLSRHEVLRRTWQPVRTGLLVFSAPTDPHHAHTCTCTPYILCHLYIVLLPVKQLYNT